MSETGGKQPQTDNAYGNDAEEDLNRKNGDKIDLKVEIKWRKHYSNKRATLD